jgi:hypothetical protein
MDYSTTSSVHMWACLDVRVNVYLKVNVLSLSTSNNICFLSCLDLGINLDVDETGLGPPQFSSNLLPYRGKLSL